MNTSTLEISTEHSIGSSFRTTLLPSTQGWRRLAILVTLIAIAWQVENWRGRKAWEAVLQEIEDNGETLDWTTLLPNNVPDDLNAAKHPIFAEVFRYESGLEPYGYYIDLKVLLERFFVGMPEIRWGDTKTPMASWYGEHGIHSPQGLLEQTQHAVPIMGALEEAFSRPRCQWFQFSKMKEYGHPYQIADSSSSKTRLRWLIHGRVLAHLELKRSDLARRELGVLIDVGQSMSEGPTVFGQLVSNALVQTTLPSTEAVLLHQNWEAEDLQAIQIKLGAIDLLGDMTDSVQFSMTSVLHRLTRVLDWDWNTPYFEFPESPLLDRIARWMPDGWHYQNFVRTHRYWREHIDGVYDSEIKCITRTDPPPYFDQCYRCPSPYTITANTIGEFDSSGFLKTAAINQTRLDLLAVLCQLQVHRLSNGEFPPSLNDLKSLPHDYVTGNPPHYERRDDDSIALASLDWRKSGDPSVFAVRYELP